MVCSISTLKGLDLSCTLARAAQACHTACETTDNGITHVGATSLGKGISMCRSLTALNLAGARVLAQFSQAYDDVLVREQFIRRGHFGDSQQPVQGP